MNKPLKGTTAWLPMALKTLMAAETVLVAWKLNLDFPGIVPGSLAAVVLQLWTCRRRLEPIITLAIAAGLAVIRFAADMRTLWEHPECFLVFLGLASLLIMGMSIVSNTSNRMPERLAAFGAAVGINLLVIVAPFVLLYTVRANSVTFDKVLYAFDGSLRFQPSFVLGRLLNEFRWLGWISRFAYGQVPIAIALLFASTLYGSTPRRPNVFLVIAGATLIGSIMYGLFPAAGPAHLFPMRFPDSAPSLIGMAWLPSVLSNDAPRNAMPSLHMTWAVLLYWNARRSALWLRIVYILFLLLTVLATLGTGEHYLIDLVVALPFALAVQTAFSIPVGELRRSLPFWAGSTGTLFWLAFLRFGEPVWLGSAMMDWGLVALTVLGSVIIERQLSRARYSPAPVSNLAPRFSASENL